MKFTKAITLFLGNLDQSVITDYELCGIVVNLFILKKFRGEPINIRTNRFPDRGDYNKKLKDLINSGVLDQHRDFPKGRVFQIIGKKGYEAGDIACSVDPFAYVSHLSAMAFHGITDRIPNMLFISSPDQNYWSKFAFNKMRNDFKEHIDDYRIHNLPKLGKIRFRKINNYPVVRISSIHYGAFKAVTGRRLRVATIGRTFLDMVREPGSCGGIRHVVDVFEEFGDKYQNLIIGEVERHGNKIEKIRTGYLLEEISKVKDDKIEKWLECVQRGGSRKLDPNEEYSSIYNERWCLSINLD